MKNIVLIGFMGSGKSTVAKNISKKLNLEVVEMDDLIVKKSGLNSINEIFEKNGEIGFRELEQETAKELGDTNDKIIDTGGGIIMSQINMLYLKENSKVFYLNYDFETIEERVSNSNTRPLFQDKEKAKELYNFRASLYEYYADDVINCKDSEKAALEILDLLKK